MPIPEKIKIGDREMVVKDSPELIALIEEARKDEKNKLYSTITTLEAKAKVLEDEKATSGKLSTEKEAKLKELQDAVAVKNAEVAAKDKELADLKKMQTGKDDKDDKDKDEKKEKTEGGVTLEQIAKLLEDREKKLREEFDGKINGVDGKVKQSDVDAYRAEQLKKYGEVIIPDLVPEKLETKEAVNKAIETAIAKSKTYIRKEYEAEPGKKVQMTLAEIDEAEEKKKSAKDDDKSKGQGGGSDFTPGKGADRPAQGAGDVSDKALLADVSKMSDAEYEKYRDQVMREAKQVKYDGAPQ